MELYLIKATAGSTHDITQLVESVEWKGSIIGAARSVSFNYINAPYDKSYRIPQVATGDYVSLMDGGIELFFGQIFGTERSTATGTISFEAYDMIKKLTESTGQYNFKAMRPEAIAAQVLNDIQVPYNNLPATGINIASMLCNGKSYYDIIMGAYTQAYKATGIRCIPMIWARGFGLWPATYTVGNFKLSDTLNVTSADIQETMDEIKNRVRIYDDKGNQVGEVKDDESLGTFGVFQNVYTVEEGVDPTTAATKMLHVTPTQKLNIEAINDNNCQSGYSVIVSDAATGLSGKYWIASDTHIWSGQQKTMFLELSFEAVMDEKEIEVEKEEAST